MLLSKVLTSCRSTVGYSTLKVRVLQALFAVIHHLVRLEQEYISIGGHVLLS